MPSDNIKPIHEEQEQMAFFSFSLFSILSVVLPLIFYMVSPSLSFQTFFKNFNAIYIVDKDAILMRTTEEGGVMGEGGWDRGFQVSFSSCFSCV